VIPAPVLEHDCGCGSAWRWAREGETAIDLGCGSGKTCLLLADAVGARGRVIGVDASPAMIALARTAPRKNLELVERRIQDLGGVLADASADLVVLDCVLTFAPERERGAILGEARRLLRHEGSLLLSDVLALDLEGLPEALASAGFDRVEVLERSEDVRRVVSGVPRFATTIRARRRD
jgi:ubiquinone/menaquinone biosynthesis C-methylase UbiE